MCSSPVEKMFYPLFSFVLKTVFVYFNFEFQSPGLWGGSRSTSHCPEAREFKLIIWMVVFIGLTKKVFDL